MEWRANTDGAPEKLDTWAGRDPVRGSEQRKAESRTRQKFPNFCVIKIIPIFCKGTFAFGEA